MVMSEKNSENHLGGVLGILRHVSELCNNVPQFQCLEKKGISKLYKKKLPKKLKQILFLRKILQLLLRRGIYGSRGNYKIFWNL